MNLETSFDESARVKLQEELSLRCRRNPKYSLRAFAKALNVDHSLLSKIIRGQRPVGKKLLNKLVAQVGPITEKAQKYDTISRDQIHLISDWYHFAIFELAGLDDFNPDPKWIAQKIGITISEARAGLERLIRMGYLKSNFQNKVQKTCENITTVGSEYTTHYLRLMQKQIIDKATWALENIPVEQRDQSSLAVAIDYEKLADLKNLIRDFRRKLNRIAASSAKKNAVYQLSVSLFPITKF